MLNDSNWSFGLEVTWPEIIWMHLVTRPKFSDQMPGEMVTWLMVIWFKNTKLETHDRFRRNYCTNEVSYLHIPLVISIQHQSGATCHMAMPT